MTDEEQELIRAQAEEYNIASFPEPMRFAALALLREAIYARRFLAQLDAEKHTLDEHEA